MESGLSYTRKYYVPLITDDEGNTLAVHVYNRDDIGPVLWLFTSLDRGYEFISKHLSQPGDEPVPNKENKAFMDVLEQRKGEIGSGGMNFGKEFGERTLTEMLPDLVKNGVGYVIVDPSWEEEQQLAYRLPLKKI
jgi:hypothetical protein